MKLMSIVFMFFVLTGMSALDAEQTEAEAYEEGKKLPYAKCINHMYDFYADFNEAGLPTQKQKEKITTVCKK